MNSPFKTPFGAPEGQAVPVAPAPETPPQVVVQAGGITLNIDTVRQVLSSYGQQLLTPEQIRTLGPQELQAYADSLSAVKQKVELEGARLQAQLETIDQQLTEARAAAEAEFGTSTPEGLEGIRAQLMGELTTLLQ